MRFGCIQIIAFTFRKRKPTASSFVWPCTLSLFNAAFWTDNHSYMTEHGYEHSNVFTSNIIANIQDAAFWMSNPSNDLINNVATNSRFGFQIAEVEIEDREINHLIEYLAHFWPNNDNYWKTFLTTTKNNS